MDGGGDGLRLRESGGFVMHLFDHDRHLGLMPLRQIGRLADDAVDAAGITEVDEDPLEHGILLI